VGGPLIVVFALGLMLKRSNLRFRVEVVNPSGGTPFVPGQVGIDPALLAQPAPPPGQRPVEVPAAAQPAPEEAVEEGRQTGEKFDLGPSYEEERQAMLEAQRQQELALLQEIFEQNLRLQEEIRQEQEPEAGAAPEDLAGGTEEEGDRPNTDPA
jgi:hypothetical protein